MSHFTSIKTKITDEEALKNGLTRLGFAFTEGSNQTVTQYGTTSKTEVKLDEAVGFSLQKDGTFAMVGDFYHSKNRNLSKYYGRNEEFGRVLENAYGIEETILRMEENQFHCIENLEAEEVDGMITMVFEQ